MYKSTQYAIEFANRTGRYSDRIHPARGLLEEIKASNEPEQSKTKDLVKLKRILSQEKIEIDYNIKKIKLKIAEAKGRAYQNSQYMEPSAFKRLNEELNLKNKLSQEIQNILRELSLEVKTIKAYGFDSVFRECAKRVLPKETYLAIWREANIESNNYLDLQNRSSRI